MSYLVHSLTFTLSLFLIQTLTERVNAQENRFLFEPVDINKMTTKAPGGFQDRKNIEKWLIYYRSQPITSEIHLIKINFDLLNSIKSKTNNVTKKYFVNKTPHLVLSPETNKSIKFENVFIQRDSESQFRVEESKKGGIENISLDVYPNEKAVWGQFHDGSNFYRIRPLGEGTHALIRVKKSEFKSCAVVNLAGFRTHDKHQLNNQPHKVNLGRNIGTCPNTHHRIKIVAAYTPEFSAGEINLYINNANQAFRNSGLDIIIELTHAYQTTVDTSLIYQTYGRTEKTASASILKAFTTPGDGLIDDVHQKRQTNRADIAVLFTSLSDAGGIAYLDPHFRKKYAFAAVDPNLGQYLTFAHEIGHIMGAHHDKKAGTNKSFPYGHGFVAAYNQWRTVMAYGKSCGNCSRKPQWSDPDQLSGIPGESNNVRLLNETVCKVANYY